MDTATLAVQALARPTDSFTGTGCPDGTESDESRTVRDADLRESSPLPIGTLRTVRTGDRRVTFRRIFAHPHWGWEIVSVEND